MKTMFKRFTKLAVSMMLVLTAVAFKPVIAEGSEPEVDTVEINKFISADLGDDKYEITLTVKGDPIEHKEAVPMPVDVVLVLDISGSMRGNKLTNMKSAAIDFVKSVFANKDTGASSKIAIVVFQHNARVVTDFVDKSMEQELIKTNGLINRLSANEGTHLEGGIYEGLQLLKGLPANDPNNPRYRAMVVMGDGAPTYGFNFTGDHVAEYPSTDVTYWPHLGYGTSNRVGTGNSRTFGGRFNNEHDLKDSVNYFADWTKSEGFKIFSIGLGLSTNDPGGEVLQGIASEDEYYWPTNASGLKGVFETIARIVTSQSPAGTNAVVVDEIGEWFDLDEVSISTHSGNATYDATTRKITWTFDEITKAGQTLKYVVKLKEGAPSNNQDTNVSAELSYKDHKGEDKDKEFPKPNVVVIRYEANTGGSVDRAVESVLVKGEALGSEAEALPEYEFVNWTSDAAGTIEVSTDESFKPLKDGNGNHVSATYYANFKLKPAPKYPYIIEHYLEDLNGNYNLDTDSVQNGTAELGAIINSTAESFDNYTENIDHEDRVVSGEISADGLTLKRYYKLNEYVVEYIAESNGEIIGTSVQTVKHGGSTTSVEAKGLEGYKFAKWDDNPITLAERNETNVTESATYTASFVPREDTKYKVEHYLKEFGSDVYKLELTVDKEGTTNQTVTSDAETFENYSENLNHPNRLTSGVVSADGKLVLRHYYDLDKYLIKYVAESNGKIIGTFEQTVEHGGSTTKVTAEGLEGYKFAEWDDNPSTLAERNETNVTASATYTASFVPKEDTKYTVEHHLQNQDKKGYTLKDTETEAGVTGQDTAAAAKKYDGFTVQPFEQLTINADGSTVVKIYYDLNEYTITYKDSLSTTVYSVDTYDFGEAIVVIANPVKEGYNFVGWDPVVPENMPANNLVVEAKWKEILPDEYRLTYDTRQPGLEIPGVDFKEGDAITPAIPELEGFEFLGWFTDDKFTEEFDFSIMPARDVTVYADWGEVLGDEDEVEETPEEKPEEPKLPGMNDVDYMKYGFILFFVGILSVMFTKKEEENA